MVQGRDDEALKILKDGAKYNKATLPPDDQIKESILMVGSVPNMCTLAIFSVRYHNTWV